MTSQKAKMAAKQGKIAEFRISRSSEGATL